MTASTSPSPSSSQVEFKVDDLVTDVDNVKMKMVKQAIERMKHEIVNVKPDMAKNVEMTKGFDTTRAESIYIAMSDEIKKYNIDVENISRALAAGHG